MSRTLAGAAAAAVCLVGAAVAVAADVKTGPSSSQSPYVVPIDLPGAKTYSILTTGDTAGDGYRMVGIPDGLGAFDNGDGTFTLLSNHELGNAVGVTRAHGAVGAFVSKWVIDKHTLRVKSGEDLIKRVFLANPDGSYPSSPTSGVAFNRFCSADLPAVSAFYNRATGKGYNGRIFTNGEENSPPFGAYGRAFAHVVTGPEAGSSYELPLLGRLAFENVVANPATGDHTVVMAHDDTSPAGQVYVYSGEKKPTGDSPPELAGLTDGNLYGIQVKVGNTPLAAEVSKSDWSQGDSFPFAAVDVTSIAEDGDLLDTAAGVTGFQRPEDGAWDPNHPSDYYFVTTSNITPASGRDGHSRLWRLRFTNPAQPQLGGTITLLVNGTASSATPAASTEGPKMFDNVAVSQSGQVFLEEDPGNSPYVAKQWLYDIASGKLALIAEFDRDRFVTGGSGFITQDEESSGVIDAADILGKGWYLFDVQPHAESADSELVEGGQYVAFHIPPGKLDQLFGK